MEKLCFHRGSIYLGHKWSSKWVCDRCNKPANLKGLLK